MYKTFYRNFLIIVLTSLMMSTWLIKAYPSYAATGLPAGFQDTQVSPRLEEPTNIKFAPDGRMFITLKRGDIRIYKNGQLLSQPFLQLPVDQKQERGVLGLTFDPEFTSNRYVYVFYSRSGSTVVNRVSRFRASASNPDVAETSSETVLLNDIPSTGGYHNGGDLHFGPDGKLYISTGDAYIQENGQQLNTLAGKILRINKDGSIPTDNPFYNQANVRKEIWAYGLRNPWRFRFSPTGVMYINDVGQRTHEEINEGQAGANYGWSTCEGACPNAGFTNPIHFYPREVGKSITGGEFGAKTNFPAQFKNGYFFADMVDGWIKVMNIQTKQVSNFAADVGGPIHLEAGPDGALYYIRYGFDGFVYKISYSGSGGATNTPTPTTTQPPSQNQDPVPLITSPSPSIKYDAGQEFTFQGSATDPEDGALSNNRLSWRVVFHHDTHNHPFLGPITNTNQLTFTIPRTGEYDHNVWYRIELTATDSSGNSKSVYQDLFPNKANITIQTQPVSMPVILNGQPQSTPLTFQSVVGITHNVEALTPNFSGTQKFNFSNWANGSARKFSFNAAATDTTYTAVYTQTAFTACDSDINQDLVVDLSDYSTLANNFLLPQLLDQRADINHSGSVDLTDYSLLVAQFLNACTP